MNLGVLAMVFMGMLLGAGFHQVNMNRKYWTMVNAGCINTNALVNLEQKTGRIGLSQRHMTEVPHWIANINSTMRLGVLAIVIGFGVNLVLMFKAMKEEKEAEQRGGGIAR